MACSTRRSPMRLLGVRRRRPRLLECSEMPCPKSRPPSWSVMARAVGSQGAQRCPVDGVDRGVQPLQPARNHPRSLGHGFDYKLGNLQPQPIRRSQYVGLAPPHGSMSEHLDRSKGLSRSTRPMETRRQSPVCMQDMEPPCSTASWGPFRGPTPWVSLPC